MNESTPILKGDPNNSTQNFEEKKRQVASEIAVKTNEENERVEERAYKKYPENIAKFMVKRQDSHQDKPMISKEKMSALELLYRLWTKKYWTFVLRIHKFSNDF